MLPLESKELGSSWMQITLKLTKAVKKLLTGAQYHKAREGVNVAISQVYRVRIKDKTPEGQLIITSPPEPGRKRKLNR